MVLLLAVCYASVRRVCGRRARQELIESPEFFADACRMDALSDAMRAVRVTGAIFFIRELAARGDLPPSAKNSGLWINSRPARPATLFSAPAARVPKKTRPAGDVISRVTLR
jgi:hypothetical protein